MQALEYHTRAMATPNGIAELENLINYIKWKINYTNSNISAGVNAFKRCHCIHWRIKPIKKQDYR
jgi:hypothetical protein